MNSELNANVESIHFLNPRLIRLRVQPDDPLQACLPGQFYTLGLSGEAQRVEGFSAENIPEERRHRLIRRAYSASHSLLEQSRVAPRNVRTVEFLISLAEEQPPHPPPRLTPRLFALQKGDRIFMQAKPKGHYTLNLAVEADALYFISTGTGLGPHLNMLHSMLTNMDSRPVVLLSCVRTQSDLAHHKELMELSARLSHLTYSGWFTRHLAAAQPRQYPQDRLPEVFAGKLGPKPTPQSHFFLCGSPAMIGAPRKQEGVLVYPPNGVASYLHSQGFEADFARHRGSVHFEAYW